MRDNNNFLNIYKNLKVLVTGTTGFKGAWLAFWLNNLGAKVTGVSLKPEKGSILFSGLRLDRKINQYCIDITNFKKLNSIVKKIKPDIIFHLAAQSIISDSFHLPLKTFQTNVLGSANILESLRINKIPYLVYITSDKCYLNLDKKKNFKETDILGGLDNYSSSKAAAEHIFSSYYNSYFKEKKFLSVASTRAGNVIGGGDMKSNRIIPDIVKAINQKIVLKLRNPKSTRPWQHVLEPLSGYLLIGNKLLNNELNTKILPSWNFGPKLKNCRNVKYITKLFLQNWDNNDLKIKFDRKINYHESKLLSLNIKKAYKELNWQPTLNLNETVKLTADWYKLFFEHKNIENFTHSQIEFFLNKYK